MQYGCGIICQISTQVPVHKISGLGPDSLFESSMTFMSGDAQCMFLKRELPMERNSTDGHHDHTHSGSDGVRLRRQQQQFRGGSNHVNPTRFCFRPNIKWQRARNAHGKQSFPRLRSCNTRKVSNSRRQGKQQSRGCCREVQNERRSS